MPPRKVKSNMQQYWMLLLAASAVASPAQGTVDKRLSLIKYCNGGTSGNGDCEHRGFNTFCCANTAWGVYTAPKTIVSESSDSKGTHWCDNKNAGTFIYCA
ncbi:hypothetical protein E4U42_006916 [Claviceps africana]|uniref:Uncharacterized protein n=1 Tax=Claviceps africana TaxID=83212 RepID=A0A8K0NGF6_9HYPO|nr:hypothetical protein E4U42_006916 [Claviceps africana]